MKLGGPPPFLVYHLEFYELLKKAAIAPPQIEFGNAVNDFIQVFMKYLDAQISVNNFPL